MSKQRFATCFFVFICLNFLAIAATPDITVAIPMRDGIELPTDIYLPKNSEEKAPCVLMRSPGGRQAESALLYTYLTEHGYCVAIQETRSAHDPHGKTLPYWSDGWGKQQDGYDTVEWLAKSAYCNGKVGTIGRSALGITQLLMAPSAPPSLKCQYIGTASASLYHDAIFQGGQLLKNQVEGWLGRYAKDPTVCQQVCQQPVYNDFWKNFDTPKVAHHVKTPAIHYGGWYDIFLQGTIDSFMSRQEQGGIGAKGTQKLVIGPWSHYWPESEKFGDFELPPSTKMAPEALNLERWLGFYLKDAVNGVDKLPAVTYYVMGPFDGSFSTGNVWRHTDKWPIPAVETAYYLATDNTLRTTPTNPSLLSYQYDPQAPIPTVGGRNLFLESGPKDQQEIEQRKDILLFTTEPLTEDLEMTGRILAKLYFSSDKPDTDLVVRLCDVYPDGRSILITDGIVRMQHHDTVLPGQPTLATIDLWSSSLVFARGHRIRVSVSSSNYPRFEKNHNGDSTRPTVATNTLHLGGVTPSHITLPLVRRGDLWLVPNLHPTDNHP